MSYVDSFIPQPSGWTHKITPEDPYARFKFSSVEMQLNFDLQQINRKTYALLDWLGDWGGLLDALFLIGDVIIQPLSGFALQAKLMTLLVGFQGSSRGDD